MKSFGKYILLLIVHIVILLVGAFALGIVFSLLLQTRFGYYFVGHLTGGMPDVTMVFVPCVISFFLCSHIADRMNGGRALLALGITILLVHIISGALNLLNGSAVIANIIQIVLGIAFILTERNEIQEGRG